MNIHICWNREDGQAGVTPANYFAHLNSAALVAGLLEERLGRSPPLVLLAERRDLEQGIKKRR
jgi:hypothetical protein